MNRLKGINIEIQITFQSNHLPLLIPFLEKVGIGSKEINEMIEAYIASGEKMVYERWILEYGQDVWNPMMNKKLGRSIDHPTFNNLLAHALKDILQGNPIVQHLRKVKAIEI